MDPVRLTWPQPALQILSPRQTDGIARPLKAPPSHVTNTVDEGTPNGENQADARMGGAFYL